MRARIIGPDEMHKIDLISSVAFEVPWEPAEPKKEEPKPQQSVWDRWLIEEGEEPCAALLVLNTDVRFDGHVVPMGGVAGVATLPQHRRKGAIRTGISAAMNHMLEKGAVFSVLYPFSRAYYRQFGYEDGASVSQWTLPFSAINPPDVGGTIELILPGSDFSPVHQVYAACSANWNLSMPESRFLCEMSKKSWMKDKHYLYIWRDETGVPAGMILFSKTDGVMNCINSFGNPGMLLFRDMRALTALLRFAKGFAADYDSIRFAVPQGVRIQSLISEGNDAHGEICYQGMVRLIDVPRALEMCRTLGEGSIVISVKDDYLPHNCASWKVAFNPEGPNAVEKTDAAPDIELPVGELTQLLLGVCTAGDIPMMPKVKVNNPAAPLERIFIPKSCHIIDLF